ncbi:integrase arm-type DNA-binding domain-containing protein [Paucibacter sp. TC2R-5]|uniref:tyrosine-type recombinase/integrase n=1 Tax=Paucibacter sp. TC2R-5 TaxID=2893555 RepID=UPI0021E48234|nr:site-specific integrase [Paucibacter sp. TC2R-5]MCV2361440.1 integrase arm-type DNA-binding domain-containing protein [Paucibacter sp. TC2R-5]
MPKKAKELSALEVSRLTLPGFYAVGGVSGLHVRIKPTGAKGWMLRVKVGDKRRDIGLGGYSQTGMTLAKAREAALAVRADLAKGVDPVEQKKAARSELIAAQAKELTFKQAAQQYIKAHEVGWRNAKHGQQWRNTLEQYAYPFIGSLMVRDVEMAHVLKVLEPIWQTTTETASRLRGRMEKVLDWAKGRGYRSGDNPAEWKGNLDAQLPNPDKIAKVEHHAALKVSEIGAFMVRLRAADGMGARALEFAILTAARSGEVRGATWAEVDLEAKVWTVPGDRMKAGKDHRVPLSPAAVQLLEALPRIEGVDAVFPAPRGGKLSDMTMTAVLRRMKVDAVPHGFRSTFRDWTAERTHYPSDVCEMALAHVVANKVEAAYRRGDLFQKRVNLMADWAAFVGRVEVAGEVIPLRGVA